MLKAAQTQATNEKTMARLREKISGLQSGMSQREAKIGELETAIAEQSKAMRAGDTLAMNQQAQISSLKCSLQGLRRDLSATRTLLDSANDELATTEQANAALQEQVDEALVEVAGVLSAGAVFQSAWRLSHLVAYPARTHLLGTDY